VVVPGGQGVGIEQGRLAGQPAVRVVLEQLEERLERLVHAPELGKGVPLVVEGVVGQKRVALGCLGEVAGGLLPLLLLGACHAEQQGTRSGAGAFQGRVADPGEILELHPAGGLAEGGIAGGGEARGIGCEGETDQAGGSCQGAAKHRRLHVRKCGS